MKRRVKERWMEDRPVVVPIEQVAVGDVIEFYGAAEHAGQRTATVTKVHPRIRMARVARRVVVAGKESIAWRMKVYEAQIIANLGPPEGR